MTCIRRLPAPPFAPSRPRRLLRRVGVLILAFAWPAACGGTGGNGSEDGAPAEGQNGSTATGAAWQESFPDFTRHVIDDFQSGYQAIAFDVDGDGREDVAALSTGGSELVWYRNPGWERYTISTAAEGYINMAPHDIDGDGDLDLAVASEFSLGNSTGGGVIHWAEAPDDPTENEEWPLHRIDAVPTSHRLKWADLDGDGSEELVNLPIVGVGASSPEYHGAVEFTAYEIPEDPTGEAWPSRILDDSRLEVAHGLAVVDWDGDGADDLLTASLDGVHLFRPALEGEGGAPAVMQVAEGHQGPRPEAGSSEVALGRLGPEGRFLATNDPWHGNQVVVYRPTESDELPWSRSVIETGFQAGHAVVTVDLNGDGYDEIVAGHRGGERNLFIYRYRPDAPDAEKWERIPMDLGGVAVSSLDVADLNDDGAPDIITIGGATDNVVWYENEGV
ncbi:MAG: FG-GAP repeat domain-containing protein [Longimicrobiales bacterium]